MPVKSWSVVLVRAVLAGAAVCALGAATASSEPSFARLDGSRAALPRHARRLSAVSAARTVDLTVALTPRDPAALAAYASAVAQPGSPDYHAYLTVAQFAHRFGATAAAQAAVRASLAGSGLTVGRVSANGLSVSVSGDARTVERAFDVALDNYAVPATGTTAAHTGFAPSAAPRVESDVSAKVQAVIGLDTVAEQTPALVHAPALLHTAVAHARELAADTAAPTPCLTATENASLELTYDKLAQAYGFDPLYAAGATGQGVTVAVYELEGNIPDDITAFEACYGLGNTVTYTEVDGGGGTVDVNDGDGEETELDVETVAALAPGASIDVYQGPNSSSGNGWYDTYAQIVTDDTAKVVSTSWGACESQEGQAAAQAESTLFQEAATQGQTILAAAGDSGSEACEQSQSSDTSLSVQDPASQPYVTGVGGTSITSASPLTESAWNDSDEQEGAGGGGISTFWPMPSYQADAASTLGVIGAYSSGIPCGAAAGDDCREVPDVSADADPDQNGYEIYWDGDDDPANIYAWRVIGGTSAAAPLWAALIADADSSSACGGTPVGFANPALYSAAAVDYSANFNDVTTGNNDDTGTGGGLYPATAGYDMATGLGTPKASALAATLCGGNLTISGAANATATAGSPLTPITLVASGASGSTYAYTATGLPAGLSIDAGTGVISGTPTAAGSYGVTVGVTAPDGRWGTASFTIVVTAPVVALASPGTVSSTAGSSVSVRITGSDSGPGETLAYTASGLPAGLSISSSGALSGTPTVAGTSTVTVTATDRTGAHGSVTFIWTVTSGSPSARMGVTGANGTRPRVTGTFVAGAGSTRQTVTVALPAGLRFASRRSRLLHGISVKASGGTVAGWKVAHGVLTVTLRAARSVTVTAGSGAISTSAAVRSALRRHRSRTYTFVSTVTDSTATRTTLRVAIRLR